MAGFPVLAIPGNCDPLDAPEIFGKRGVNLHERSEDVDGIVLAGFGGSNVTPFGTPFEMDEEEIFSRLKSLLEPLKGRKMILAVHCPPKDTESDKTSTGLHAGSTSVRKAVTEYSPSLVVCSHIHEAGGSTDRVGSTVIANIGRLGKGSVGVINIDRDISITLTNMGK